MTRWRSAWLLVLVGLTCPACNGGGDDDDSAVGDDDTTGAACDDAEPVGLLDDAGLLPYPSVHLMTEDPSTASGWRLAFPEDTLPVSEGGTPLDTNRLNRLDGFSPVNTSVVLLPHAEIDATTLPSVHDLAGSVEATSSVQIIDLESGERLPCFAELDAHPQCTGPADRTLLIRPMRAMAFATHHAVVITDAVRDTSGDPVAAPERFAALRDGGDVHPGLCASIDHYEALFARLQELGIARQDLVLAWDFWTASEESIHAPLDRIIEAGREALPAEPTHDPEYAVDWISDTDEGHYVNDHIWRVAQGSYQLPNYLQDDHAFSLDNEVLPEPQGDAGMYYMAMVRTAGAPLLLPGVEPPYDVGTAEAPLGPHAMALMQFDPQMGRPSDENRPADTYGAHDFIRHTEEVHAQIEAFFAEGEEGTIIHPCGDEPCIF